MGNHCVAAIELHEEESGICSVIYYRTHFGHDQNIAFLHLSGSDREAIAGKIAEGVTFQRILDDVRDSVHSSGVERLHLLTRHDLHNIKRDFAIGDDQQHNIDEVSVGMWLEKMKDCVLLYKKEGEAREDFDRTDSVIVLMTDYQKQLLQRFGQNIVCVDSTHCTNVYKLLVTTLLVVDDFGSGMPVAFCVSNRETTSIMTHFFSAVKERAGIIKTSVFMSDDTNSFRSAWSRVMGPAENNLLGAWHIDRSWRNNLKKVHGNEEKKALVYKALRTLLEEADIDNFNKLLESFVGQLQADEGKVSTEILKSLQKDAAHSLSLFQSDCREASRPPSNEKVKVQRRHGKCNKQPKGSLKKPTLAEKENIVSALRQPESEILNVHINSLLASGVSLTIWQQLNGACGAPSLQPQQDTAARVSASGERRPPEQDELTSSVIASCRVASAWTHLADIL
ncbi:uncharacterized protein LOC126470929 [Schistocerca serialis cubense]|uniref:uncharacterized protein LOC126470929 n=1 Tax=Schistocerca serialis cubense TaxID=2023355 RepID=UPI00214F0C48|nr:uncharacterized protein LOC126470929 [Schistocerca serialis cubense]